jgi:hypothetical protein
MTDITIRDCGEGDCENGVLIRRLQNENKRLREALSGARFVVHALKSISKPELHPGFDMWLEKMDEGLRR